MRRTSDIPRWGHKWGLALTIPMAAAIAAIGVYVLTLEFQADLSHAKARRERWPTTFGELDAWYETPPRDQNAALDLAKAFTLLTPWSPDGDARLVGECSRLWPPTNQPLPHELITALQECVARHENAIALFHRVVPLPRARYPVKYSLGDKCVMPHLIELRRANRVLQFDAILAAELQQPDRATASLAAMLALAHSLDHEPHLHASMVRTMMLDIFIQTLPQVFSRVQLHDEQIQQLADATTMERDQDALLRALVGNRVNLLEAANLVSSPGCGGSLSRSYARDMISADLRQVDRLIECVRTKTLSDLTATLGDVKSGLPALGDVKSGTPRLGATRGGMSPMGSVVTYLTIASSRRMAATAFAIERYRLAHETIPESLGLLGDYGVVPPVDPYTDQPIKFARVADGYSLACAYGEPLTVRYRAGPASAVSESVGAQE